MAPFGLPVVPWKEIKRELNTLVLINTSLFLHSAHLLQNSSSAVSVILSHFNGERLRNPRFSTARFRAFFGPLLLEIPTFTCLLKFILGFVDCASTAKWNSWMGNRDMATDPLIWVILSWMKGEFVGSLWLLLDIYLMAVLLRDENWICNIATEWYFYFHIIYMWLPMVYHYLKVDSIYMSFIHFVLFSCLGPKYYIFCFA